MLATTLPQIADGEAQRTANPSLSNRVIPSGKCYSSHPAARSSGTVPGAVEGKCMGPGTEERGSEPVAMASS